MTQVEEKDSLSGSIVSGSVLLVLGNVTIAWSMDSLHVLKWTVPVGLLICVAGIWATHSHRLVADEQFLADRWWRYDIQRVDLQRLSKVGFEWVPYATAGVLGLHDEVGGRVSIRVRPENEALRRHLGRVIGPELPRATSETARRALLMDESGA